MKRFQALIRDTWWLWCLLLGSGVLMSLLMSKVFLLIFPICIVIFLWFAFIRYDEDGNFTGS